LNPRVLADTPSSDVVREAARPLPSISVGGHVFERRLLGNGLHAVAVADADAGKGVSVFMVIGAGKRQETAETTGLAHLVEHAMYTGTSKVSAGEHDRRIEKMGGESNAFTREDITLFYDDNVPVDRLDEVLALEADRLRGVRFCRRAIEHERKRLIIEEENSWQPPQRRTELLEAAVYTRHPYRVGLLDEKGHTLAAQLDRQAMRAFYDRYYQPNNAAVVVAGAVDSQGALDAIEKAFGALSRGPNPDVPPGERQIQTERSVEIPSALAADRVEWVWLVPAMGDPDRPALDVLARLLTRGESASEQPISASMGSRVDKDIFRLAATGPNASEQLDQWLGRLLAGDIKDEEIKKDKALQRVEMTDQPLRARPYLSLAATFGAYEVLGHADLLEKYQDSIDRLTKEDLLRVARRYLNPSHRVVVRFLGTGAKPKPLPDDSGALLRAAMDADEGGDLDRAAEAYTKLLKGEPNKMERVMFLASRGQVRMQQRDYDAAIADFKAALEIIDYPAVRDLLNEAQAAKLGLVPKEVLSPEAPQSPPKRRQDDETFKTSEGEEDLMRRVDEAKTELTAWRGLSFSKEIIPEWIPQRDDKLAGRYDSDHKRLVVVEGRSDRLTQGAFLHEMAHALQDQNWDLEKLESAVRTRDQQHALTALIEGEAMLAVSEIMAYDFESHAALPAAGEIDREKFKKLYDYGAGLRFVRSLQKRGGWELVNEAWRSPPQTSSEIFHPARYPSPPVEAFAPAIAGGVVVREDRLGEFEVRWLLIQEESTRSLAEPVGSALVVDSWRLVAPSEDASNVREVWDLRFHDEDAARQFVEAGQVAIDHEGWQIERKGRDVRLQRAYTLVGTTN